VHRIGQNILSAGDAATLAPLVTFPILVV